MNTEIISINDEEFNSKLIEAGQIIKKGGLVAFPTETVYGLGGDALNPESSKKIYGAKGRPSDNPLIVHIAKIDDIYKIADGVDERALKLMKSCWPGPLTIVLRKKDIVPYETTGGLDTVAVRMPKNECALKFIELSGGFIAAPSANSSGRPSPTMASHVYEDLGGKIEMIIDGGDADIGVESTIVDLSGDVPMLLRPGYIDILLLKEILGEISIDPSIAGNVSAGDRPKAPGMMYRHYAPKGDMYIVKGNQDAVINKINELVDSDEAAGKKAGIIALEETADNYKCGIIRMAGSEKDEASIAKKIYAILREFDSLGVDIIYSEEFDTPRLGMAIMNRLMKAAGHKVINLKED